MSQETLLKKAESTQREVMELCQMLVRHLARNPFSGSSWANELAVRDQLIEELMVALGDICHLQNSNHEPAYRALSTEALEELIAKGRHVLDNVRLALPKTNEHDGG